MIESLLIITGTLLIAFIWIAFNQSEEIKYLNNSKENLQEQINYLREIEWKYTTFKKQIKIDYKNKLITYAKHGRSDLEIYREIKSLEDSYYGILFSYIGVGMDKQYKYISFGDGWSAQEVKKIELYD